MAMFIPCPACGENLSTGILEACPSCGWKASPEEREATMKQSAMQIAQQFGRIHGSRIRARVIATLSLALNVILAGILIYLLVR